jgi:hypothetical protein
LSATSHHCPSIISNMRRGLVSPTTSYHHPSIASNARRGLVLSTTSHHRPSIPSNARRGLISFITGHQEPPMPPLLCQMRTGGLSRPLMATNPRTLQVTRQTRGGTRTLNCIGMLFRGTGTGLVKFTRGLPMPCPTTAARRGGDGGVDDDASPNP